MNGFMKFDLVIQSFFLFLFFWLKKIKSFGVLLWLYLVVLLISDFKSGMKVKVFSKILT